MSDLAVSLVTCLFSIIKINNRNLTESCFWAKAKEEKLERKDLFEELSRTFAAKGAPKKLDKEDGGEKVVQKKKAKELKVLDPKSAQNMCKS
jgi:hypothetical protein